MRHFSAKRGAVLLGLVVYPLLAWWLAFNYHACGVQGAELAVVFLAPLAAFAAIPALLLFVAFAFVPVRIRPRATIVCAGIETVALVAVYGSITMHQIGTGACSV